VRATMNHILTNRDRSLLRPMLTRALSTLALSSALLTTTAFALGVGQRAPDFSLPDAGNTTTTLTSMRGHVVVVDFWASWCGPCLRSLPWLDAMRDRYAAQGLTVIAINLDQKRSDADRFLARVPLKLPLAFDPSGSTAKNYEVKAMPTSFLIARDGTIRAIHPGFRDADGPARETEITQALAAGPAK
jgi:cytochrome c biogenesis protein CcmG/thiol:disulfide interchange protein DsbE